MKFINYYEAVIKDENMVIVELRCPKCNKAGKVEVEDEIILNCTKGVSAVNIKKDLICDHSFCVYLDKHFECRDCFIIDFTVELPELKKDIDHKDITHINVENIDLFLISINLGALKLTYILRAILMGKKVVLINDFKQLTKYIKNLLNFIIQDMFQYEFSIITPDDYAKNEKQYKNYLIIGEKKLINDKEKFFAENRIKVESSIIVKFLNEIDEKSSLIILKNEVWKSRKISNDIKNILKKKASKKKIAKKDLITILQKKNFLKISLRYLEFVLEILKNHDRFDLSNLSNYYLPGFRV